MKKDNDENVGAEPSKEMLRNFLNDIKRYKKFDDFLLSVKAMGNDNGRLFVIEYPLGDIEKYENSYVKKYSTGSLNDSFVFADKAKRYKQTESGKKISTTFIPRTFFSYLLNTMKGE